LRAWDGLRDLPLFDEDLERAPEPAAVAALRTAIRQADGLLLASPEYNGAIPAGLKNAVDWASRPYGNGVLVGKPAAVIGASVTPYGAARAQQQLRAVLAVAGATVVDADLPVPEAFRQFDDHGELIDVDLRDGLRLVLAALREQIDGGRAAA
ncbi:MAG: NADPH-dependent FMN reductase, partial [Thermocrispum sp.]